MVKQTIKDFLESKSNEQEAGIVIPSKMDLLSTSPRSRGKVDKDKGNKKVQAKIEERRKSPGRKVVPGFTFKDAAISPKRYTKEVRKESRVELSNINDKTLDTKTESEKGKSLNLPWILAHSLWRKAAESAA